MTANKLSPKIKNLSWGKVEVEGFDDKFKDVKLYPGGARKWDWNETGTEHSPGVQINDVEELVKNGAKEVILSRGYFRRLKVKDDTLEYLEKKKIPVHIMDSKNAVKKYNELAEAKKKVGILIHSTC
jgi:hypothetical protein